MKRMIGNALIWLGIAAALAAQTPAQKPAQAPGAAPSASQDSRATAYYNFSMGHMYAELAAAYGYRSEYVDKAIEHYRAAMKADPSAAFLSEELTDIYMQAGKLSDAIREAEQMLVRNPDNVDARRMLGRIYSRMIGDQQQNRINENMLKNAIEQYRRIVQLEPKDTDSWLMLGRLEKIAQDSVESEKAYKKALELDPNNEYALSGLALVYSDLGDTQRALQMWQRLSDKNPSPRTLKALAQAYEQAHDYKSAAQALKRVLELDPRNLDVKKNLAEDLLLAGEGDAALKLYYEIAAADPKDARVQVRISQIFRQKHDFAKAREAQQRALQLEPDNLEIQYNEVNLLDAEGKYPEAIARMKQILEGSSRKTYNPSEASNRVFLLERLALLYRANEQYAEAVQVFEQMPQVDADSAPRAAAQVADTWRQAKEFTKALQAADAAAQKYPDNRTVKLVRSSVLSDMGRYDEAIAVLKPMLGGNADREIQLALAQIYDKAKRHEDTARALDAAEKLSDTDEEKETVYFMRGAMYEKQKQVDKAEAEFRKVLKLNPDNAAALNYLGYMLADRNLRLEEAHKMIAKALELEPNNGAYLDSLGWVLFRLGRLEEAEHSLLEAIARTAHDPVVYDHLGDVYLQKGNLKEAIAQWERSLREWDAAARSEFDPVEVAKVNKKLESARVRLAKETSKPTADRR